MFCLAIRDISERKRSEERMQYQAFHDSLTNLPNHVLFNKQLAIALAEAQRNQTLLAVMFLDLDSFKHINNTLGHKIGDQILQSFSRRLTACVRAGDTVARWESDEFIVLLPKIKNTEDTVKLSHRIFEALKQPFVIEKYQLQLKTSIRIAIYLVLDQIGLDPQWLELEFTEKTLRHHLNSVPLVFQDLQNIGVRLCLDDLGTGHSAIGYLKQFSLRTVKIHQTFIRDLRDNTQDLAMIAAITALGAVLRREFSLNRSFAESELLRSSRLLVFASLNP